VLVEGCDGSLAAVFEHMEAGAIEAVNGVAVVGDYNIHEDKAGAGVEQRRFDGGLHECLRCVRRLLCGR
jgi:hypothetical protein